MRVPTRVAALFVAALTMLVGFSLPASAQGRHHPLGDRSLAEVLAKDTGFDRNWNDFDITEAAVLAVLKAKPDSPVKVLADGTTPLTAFLPTDRAFRRLASDLTGDRYTSEQAVFDAVAGLGIDTVETVLLYHVVPGKTITLRKVLRSDGAKLKTAQGGTIKVDVRLFGLRGVALVDKDPDARNPLIVRPNINKGNVQIAHGINRVLRPVDLP